jgi:uncharacterized protein (TIGR02145 family)
VSGDESACNVYGALYTWETAMMVDGKYADETKTSTAWDESWVSPNYYLIYTSPPPGTAPNADKNSGRGGTNVKGGGRGICPMGWHVPTLREWTIMFDKVEGNGTGTTYTLSQNSTGLWGIDAGKKLKSSKVLPDPNSAAAPADGSWTDHANRGTDDFGFCLLPAGCRYYTGAVFYYRGINTIIWSSTAYDLQRAFYHEFMNNTSGVNRAEWVRAFGISVRCVKD